MNHLSLVYMVAGLSSRYGGRIKALARVGPEDETLIEYSLKEALPAGFDKIVLVTSDKTRPEIQSILGREFSGIPIFYVNQQFDPVKRDRPWGTLDALCSAIPAVNEPFVICNGDDLYGEASFQKLSKHLSQFNTPASIGYPIEKCLPPEGEVTRGIFYVKNGNVERIEEKGGISRLNFKSKELNEGSLCNGNIFGFPKESLKLFEESLKRFKKENAWSRDTECLIPVEISNLLKRREMELRLYLSTEPFLGVTNPGDETLVREILKKRSNEAELG